MEWIDQVFAGASDLKGTATNLLAALLIAVPAAILWCVRWCRRRVSDLKDGPQREQDESALYWLTHLHRDVDLPIRTFANAHLAREALRDIAAGGALMAIAFFVPRLVGSALAGIAVVAFCEAYRRTKMPKGAVCKNEERAGRIAELRTRLGHTPPQPSPQEIEAMKATLGVLGYTVQVKTPTPSEGTDSRRAGVPGTSV